MSRHMHPFQRSINRTINYTNGNRFDYFIEECNTRYNKPVGNLLDMRIRQDRKVRGDFFELFCQRYLQTIYKESFVSVWLWNEIPERIRTRLELNKQDQGIDIIAVDTKNRYYAVQVKYRKYRPEKSKQFISWKELSTFYALAFRTGHFYKHIVMTNVDGVRHVTKKNSKDISICKRTFQKMTFWSWKKFQQETMTQQEDIESVRQKRLQYYK